MKKLLLIVVVLMMLGGCGEKTKTTTCTYKQDAFDYQVIMESKEDKIEKMRYISVLDFAALGVDDESLIKTKNQRGIVKKIRAFRDFLDNNLEFDTEYVLVGDGISISKRRSSNE